MHPFPLEPDRAAMTEMGRLVLDRVVDRTEDLAARPATSPLSRQAAAELVESFLAPPPARGGDMNALLARLDEAADCALAPKQGTPPPRSRRRPWTRVVST
ncbi:hypothetical protein [Streptomyces massasporeus]|uniref:hypothetical protein n=1 Tax=Streptomyces massasporeus TaxID=67324 RepID=UPI003331ACDD